MQAFPYTSLNVSAEHHYAETIRDWIMEQIALIESEPSVDTDAPGDGLASRVKAIITDAASDCRKARELVVQMRPEMLSLDCFSHQVSTIQDFSQLLCKSDHILLASHLLHLNVCCVAAISHARFAADLHSLLCSYLISCNVAPQINLMVGAYINKQFGAADAMKMAIELIHWWKWHLVAFSYLQAEMDRPLALLTGCLTRWGSQVAALIRLLQFKDAMRVVLLRKKALILGGIKNRQSRDTAIRVLGYAESDGFWTDVTHMVQNLLPLRIALRTVESDSARLDQVMEQYGNLAHHYSGTDHMMQTIEYRWAKMDQKLFLLAYVLHPARQLQHINQRLPFAYSTSIVDYAIHYYQRFFGVLTAEDEKKLWDETVSYLGKKGVFAKVISKQTDPKQNPDGFWHLVRQSAPHLSRLANHLFQICVNSAAVERLFSAFGNIQTKRRNRFVHERVQKIALIRSVLPPKHRSAKKPAGNQYLSARPTRSSIQDQEIAAAELKEAEALTMREFVDGPEDLLLEAEQVDCLVEEYGKQIADDAHDDVDYLYTSVARLDTAPEEEEEPPNRCMLADLFVDMPPFDLNMLFEEDLTVTADIEGTVEAA